MQAAVRQACASCMGCSRQLSALRLLPLAHSGSWQYRTGGHQQQPCATLSARGRQQLQHHAGASMSYLPARQGLVAYAAASAAAPVLKRAKKHKAPGTAPGPMPLDVPPGKPVVILGIDPDASGAFVTLEWSAAAARTEEGLPTSLADAVLQVFDMPMETIALEKRSRRQADASVISEQLNALVPPLAAKATVHCILEQPVPNALNGKFSWFQSGYAYGVWNGVLANYSMRKQVISASRWKRDMGLYGKGKEGSRQLALALFPQAAEHLKRKKDHGRAEALLLAAWASGIEMPAAAFETAQAVLDEAEAGVDGGEEVETAGARKHDQLLQVAM